MPASVSVIDNSLRALVNSHETRLDTLEGTLSTGLTSVAAIQAAFPSSNSGQGAVTMAGTVMSTNTQLVLEQKFGGGLRGQGSGHIAGNSNSYSRTRLVAGSSFDRATSTNALILLRSARTSMEHFCIDGKVNGQSIAKCPIGLLVKKTIGGPGVNTGSIAANGIHFEHHTVGLQFDTLKDNVNGDGCHFQNTQFVTCDTAVKVVGEQCMRNDFRKIRFENCSTFFHFTAGGKFLLDRGYAALPPTGVTPTLLFLDSTDGGIDYNNSVYRVRDWDQDNGAGEIKLLHMTPGEDYQARIFFEAPHINSLDYTVNDKRAMDITGITDVIIEGGSVLQEGMFAWHNDIYTSRYILRNCWIAGTELEPLFYAAGSTGSCRVECTGCRDISTGAFITDFIHTFNL